MGDCYNNGCGCGGDNISWIWIVIIVIIVLALFGNNSIFGNNDCC